MSQTPFAWWMRLRWRLGAMALTGMLATLAGSAAALAQNPQGGTTAQPRRTAPRDSYFLHFRQLNEGLYSDAYKNFDRELRSAIRGVQGRWIDSICYYTMRGECSYQMGRLADALDDFSTALVLVKAFPDWMIRVDFPTPIQPQHDGAIRQIPWGQSQRGSRPGRFADNVLISQGRLDNTQVIQEGGLFQPPVLFSVNATEIVRTTALAIRRRAELLGPAGAHDSLTKEILTVLAARPTQRNHWSEAWIDVQLGLAYMAADKLPQAKELLQRGLLVQGQFDHPLTSVALFELGRIAMKEDDLPLAANLFAEATYAAVQFPDMGILDEAFRHGALVHLLMGAEGVYPPLDAATRWARLQGLRQLHASLLISAAENYVTLGQSAQADAALVEARRTIGRRDMSAAALGARLNFVAAQTLYQQGQVGKGDEALAAALEYQRGGSHRLFQTQLTDQLFAAGTFSPRVAIDLYDQLLPDPTPTQWSQEPLESLSSIVGPKETSLIHWFEVALERREREKALEIADAYRRHRFMNSTPLGGRLLGLRWVLEAPAEALDQQALLERQDMLARHPQYAELSQQAARLQQELARLPLLPDDNTVARQQGELLKQLANFSSAQETYLRQLAVRREPCELAFPPRHRVKDIQTRLGDGQAVLAFFVGGKGVYGFLLNRERLSVWPVAPLAKLENEVARLLREMGQTDGNRTLSWDELRDEKWKGPAQSLLELLVSGAESQFPGDIRELVVVPDGVLWYVPFGALQVPVGESTQSLASLVRLRWSPTVSLAVGDGRPQRQVVTTAVVPGRLFLRSSDSGLRGAEEIARVVPRTVTLSGSLPSSSALFGGFIDRLAVLDESAANQGDPLAWAPLKGDRATPGDQLRAWLDLPWGGPEELILPAYRSRAENALKNSTREMAGDDLFLPLCGLMASGARTVLLSTWRTGGATSIDLVREFVQELPHTTAADAWQRSVMVAMETPLHPEGEPRVEPNLRDDPPTAHHPFFWSGFVLVDSLQPTTPREAHGDPGVAAAP